MKKSNKKWDSDVVRVLTEVCEKAKNWGCGFEWLTHTANYHHFPDSLMIICVFSTDNEVALAVKNGIENRLHQHIREQLRSVDIALKNINRHVSMDSEESCLREHNGNWNRRIQACRS